jgi:hypothetical protein
MSMHRDGTEPYTDCHEPIRSNAAQDSRAAGRKSGVVAASARSSVRWPTAIAGSPDHHLILSVGGPGVAVVVRPAGAGCSPWLAPRRTALHCIGARRSGARPRSRPRRRRRARCWRSWCQGVFRERCSRSSCGTATASSSRPKTCGRSSRRRATGSMPRPKLRPIPRGRELGGQALARHRRVPGGLPELRRRPESRPCWS